ncbi:2-hydroxycarboxylate transporter family protein [Gulosibacter molinativorax]|uniref:Ribonuclease BN n=1 Tax=Gulosibacter molinativorax TaxID=256821 RepID=A0ABT7C6M8_9MICO|nr:2-hydroxycarboxylate transporter family protein [Gulosibacter molinativorax]MDJ1370680.1 ribonuclease BN [Gulosibacter molinativorax]QUY63293.1 Ribonuclease BN [Gulosibacter molinativorax]
MSSNEAASKATAVDANAAEPNEANMEQNQGQAPKGPSRTEMIATSNPAIATQKKRYTWRRINDMPIWWFLAVLATVAVAVYTGNLPEALLGGFAVTLTLGGLLTWIGSMIPGLRDYGLATLLCTFVPSAIIFFGLMPEIVTETVTAFMTEVGFLDFIVAAIITGAVLGMPRKLLIKAGPRFLVPLAGCIVLTFAIIGGLGALFGRGFIETMLLIAAPTMAGGIGVGAIPMSEMYAAETGQDVGVYFAQLVAVTALANGICILIAGIVRGLGSKKPNLFPGFYGGGQLMRIEDKNGDLTMPKAKASATFLSLGKGLLITAVLYTLANVLNAYMPLLHTFAWLIISAAILKIFNLFPSELEEAATEWGSLMTTYFVPALLVGVSIAYINLEEVIHAVADPVFLLLVVLCVAVSGLVAGFLGYLLKFYFVEAMVIPGFVMADSGGSGDVAVLSASNLMHLMPFAALATRIGGAFTLFITALLVPLLSVVS